LQSAQLKNCEGPVAGRADILLAHDLNAANALYKSLVYFAQSRVAALVLGFSAPVVLTSRADNAETKYLSMSLGLLCADHQNSVC
jgi:phosphate butyryltransferase